MPAQRLPWIKFWPEALDHEKFAELTDAEAWTWVVIWAKASLQPKRWRFASVEHACHVTGRKPKLVRRLVEIGLLDETENGLLIHNAKKWQELSNLTPTQRQAALNEARMVTEAPANGDGTVIYEVPNGDLEGEGDKELTPPLSPVGGRTTVPKPKRARVPITDSDAEELVSKYTDRYGTPQAVRDEIELALNHQARFKNLNERLYVDGWLRRELNHRPGQLRAVNGHAEPPRKLIDRTGIEN